MSDGSLSVRMRANTSVSIYLGTWFVVPQPRMHPHRALLIVSAAWSLCCSRYADGQDESAETMNDTDRPTIPSHIVVTSWNDMPFSGIVEENGKWVGRGYAFYIFDLVSAKLNFTYSIVPPNEHVLGDENNGVLGLLYEKKVDMAVAFLPVLPEIGRFCEFSIYLDETRLTALMKRPKESASGSGLLAPFERTVWFLVLASLIFMGPIIYLFAIIRAKLWHDPKPEGFGLSSCSWFAYSSLLKQGTNIVARTDSTRMLFATWWIFILILTSFYTANLTAFLTKPQFTLSISSLQDIVQKGYSWVTYKGRLVDFLLSQEHVNDLSLLNISRSQGKGEFKFYEPSKAILNSVSTKKLFLAEAHYLQTLIFEDYVSKTRNQTDHSLRCTYVIMPGSIMDTNRAFGFSNGSTARKPLNEMLIRLVESGIVQQTQQEDLPLAEICPVDLRSTERQLRNTDLLLTYKVVIAGYTIAAIFFLIEIIYACLAGWVKRRKQQNLRNSRSTTARVTNTFVKPLPSPKQVHFLNEIPQANHGNSQHVLMQGKQQVINGRNYYVVVDRGGDRRLIPIRTPSAFLFQYAV
ncbi:ionotropic receptor 76b isoform X2 [Lasioglossum baleicum]|uniref:ionotropic receptor 76b isoform X2 n=1 Tax=Lasioglossum baleicum TaxID=434251 RepID=UPI003FCCE427